MFLMIIDQLGSIFCPELAWVRAGVTCCDIDTYTTEGKDSFVFYATNFGIVQSSSLVKFILTKSLVVNYYHLLSVGPVTYIAEVTFLPYWRNKQKLLVQKYPIEYRWVCLFNFTAFLNAFHICEPGHNGAKWSKQKKSQIFCFLKKRWKPVKIKVD